MTRSSRNIVSTLRADGKLVVELVESEVPDPTGREILVRVEAAPINPSDLNLMFGPVDLAAGEFSRGRIVAPMPEAAMPSLAGRYDLPMPIGSEGAGTVIAAGDAPEAQALLGKRVACRPGGIYADYRIADARLAMPLPEDLPTELAAASFVNPTTTVGFVETMRKEGFTGLIHTAAASNLGQMLVKLCAEEGVPLVNIVRKAEHAELLKGIGAEHVVDSSRDDFREKLIAAIDATGARLAFDAIGGGTRASDLLSAMEAVCAKDLPYSRYGSSERKKVYVYGTLDFGPTIIHRNAGFTWEVAGWLVTPFLMSLTPEEISRVQERVLRGLKTTFVSNFKRRIDINQLFERDVALACNAKATGEKFLLTPNG